MFAGIFSLSLFEKGKIYWTAEESGELEIPQWGETHNFFFLCQYSSNIFKDLKNNFCDFHQTNLKSLTLIFFFQVRCDYLMTNFDNLDLDVAIQLCCLEIRRFFKDISQFALEKKSNFEYLEKVGDHTVHSYVQVKPQDSLLFWKYCPWLIVCFLLFILRTHLRMSS